MCYRVAYNFDEVEARSNPDLKIDRTLAEFGPKYNVSISSDIPVIVPGSRMLDVYQWGLIPHWAKDRKISNNLANARAESLEEKPSFKEIFKTKRCLVLVSGFFEWDKNKQPYYVQVKNRKIIAFAGLFDEWSDEKNKIIKSCTIITTEPNNQIKEIHNRMPVILDPKDYEPWLKEKDLVIVKGLLKPYKNDLVISSVTRKMNSVFYQNKDSIDPIKQKSDEGDQKKLF